MFSKTQFAKVVKRQTKLFNSYLDNKPLLSVKGQAIVDAVKVCTSHKSTILAVCSIMIDEDLTPYAVTSGNMIYPLLACIKLKDNPNSHTYALDKVYIIGGNRKAIKEKLFGNQLPTNKKHFISVTNEEIDAYVKGLDIPMVISRIIKEGAYTSLTKILDKM